MTSYFTRSQQQILYSTPNYNTRLQSRIRDVISNEFSQDIEHIHGAHDIRIDFDEASKACNANKKRVGQSYEYVCGTVTSSGRHCQRKPLNNTTTCKSHT